TDEPIQIGNEGIREIIQNIKTIIATIKGTVPLDRTFGITGDFIDKPLPVAQAMFSGEIVEEVQKQESRVTVKNVSFVEDQAGAIDGSLAPKVTILINEDEL
ncbi:MAG: hypothetical protein GY729_03780, partial [Desulfobacteraceae bacterium]|nr:hypothetical protein [Desulfobacteraceae bacterium]